MLRIRKKPINSILRGGKMNISRMKRKLHISLLGDKRTDYAPFFDNHFCEFHEFFSEWNPYSLKDAIRICQFRTDKAESKVFLPDGSISIMIKCDPDDPKAEAIGIYNKMHLYHFDGNSEYLFIYPYSFQAMRNYTMIPRDFLNSTVSFLDVFPFPEFIEMLVKPEPFIQRVNLILDFFKKNLIDETYINSLLDYCLVALCIERGLMKIEKLSEIMGYSDSYIRKQFAQNMGYSPKKYNSMLRIHRVVKDLDAGISIQDATHAAGYYDESHMYKDFSRFSHMTPREFVKILQSGYRPESEGISDETYILRVMMDI